MPRTEADEVAALAAQLHIRAEQIDNIRRLANLLFVVMCGYEGHRQLLRHVTIWGIPIGTARVTSLGLRGGVGCGIADIVVQSFTRQAIIVAAAIWVNIVFSGIIKVSENGMMA